MRRIRRWCLRLLIAFGLAVLAVTAYLAWNRPRPRPPTEIFQGVVYTCEEIPGNSKGTGLLHLAQVDLTQPGIELYVTPMDDEAVAHGFEYSLGWTPWAARQEHLSVAVNGPIFTSNSRLMLPGAYARSLRTVVADHRANRVDRDSYLLWFDGQLTPHLEKTKPPPEHALRRAKWAVSGEMVVLDHGKPNPWASREPMPQVLVGIDARRELLFLAAFDYASLGRAAEILADRGVADAIHLDSGDAASMVIGPGAAGVPSLPLLWPKHGAATCFGVRAPVLEE